MDGSSTSPVVINIRPAGWFVNVFGRVWPWGISFKWPCNRKNDSKPSKFSGVPLNFQRNSPNVSDKPMCPYEQHNSWWVRFLTMNLPTACEDSCKKYSAMSQLTIFSIYPYAYVYVGKCGLVMLSHHWLKQMFMKLTSKRKHWTSNKDRSIVSQASGQTLVQAATSEMVWNMNCLWFTSKITLCSKKYCNKPRHVDSQSAKSSTLTKPPYLVWWIH